jgi:hypothetical protein
MEQRRQVVVAVLAAPRDAQEEVDLVAAGNGARRRRGSAAARQAGRRTRGARCRAEMRRPRAGPRRPPMPRPRRTPMTAASIGLGPARPPGAPTFEGLKTCMPSPALARATWAAARGRGACTTGRKAEAPAPGAFAARRPRACASMVRRDGGKGFCGSLNVDCIAPMTPGPGAVLLSRAGGRWPGQIMSGRRPALNAPAPRWGPAVWCQGGPRVSPGRSGRRSAAAAAAAAGAAAL